MFLGFLFHNFPSRFQLFQIILLWLLSLRQYSSSKFPLLWALFVLLLSTLMSCQPTGLILSFFCFINFPILPPTTHFIHVCVNCLFFLIYNSTKFHNICFITYSGFLLFLQFSNFTPPPPQASETKAKPLAIAEPSSSTSKPSLPNSSNNAPSSSSPFPSFPLSISTSKASPEKPSKLPKVRGRGPVYSNKVGVGGGGVRSV